MLKSNGKQYDFMTELFHDNEVITNRRISIALLLSGCVLLILSAFSLAGKYDLADDLGRESIIAAGVMDVAVHAFAAKRKYDYVYLKRILLAAVLITSSVLFLFYPVKASTIYYAPIVMSALYFDADQIKRISALSWAIYAILIAANVILEAVSPEFAALHAYQGLTIWKIPKEVFLYNFIPHTIFYFLTYYICAGIAKRGIYFVTKQASMTSEINEVEEELRIASDIQTSSLPATEYVTDNGNVRVNASVHPARTVGGDFYDYFMIGPNIIFLIADVSDKGLTAAMFMMKAKDVIRSSFRRGRSLQEALTIANNILCRDNDGNIFVTLWAAIVNVNTGVGKYVNCGHPGPYVRHTDGTAEKIENDPEIFIGAFENCEISSHVLELRKGDTILLYTDGLTDAVNGKNEFFGDERVVESVKAFDEGKASLCDSVVGDVMSFSGETEQYDDITALSIGFADLKTAYEEEFVRKADYDSLEEILDRVNELLEENGCPEEIRRNIDVVIDEICGNIIDYAYPEGDGELKAKISVGENYIKFTASDSGMPFNPLEAEETEITSEPKIGGFGIFLVKKIADSVSYTREGDENRLEVMKMWNNMKLEEV